MKQNQMISLASGDVLSISSTRNNIYINQDVDIDSLKHQINNNLTSSAFRLFVLYPDETIAYEIPDYRIKVGGSYSENYQNGQRRSLSFTLENEDGFFTPNINTFWAGTRLRLEFGLKLSDEEIIWFQKGIFIITKLTPNLTPSGKEVQVSASDKFSLFEDATGKIDTTYEIPIDSDIEDLIHTILLTDMGNGSPLDPIPCIYNGVFKGKKTQSTISKSAGDTLGSILLDIATQLNAEIFYNSAGHLILAPIDDVSLDVEKPLIYEYDTSKDEMSQLDFSFNMNQIINRIIVIGNTSLGGVFRAVAQNNDPSSPLCYQRIGYRTGNIINDSNIYSDVLAQERANYELRQQLILKSSTSAQVLFNPLLEVNNLITITDSFFNLNKERFLLQSISCSLDFSGQMSISFSNLHNLPFIGK